MTKPHSEEYIEEQREKLLSALDAEGINPEDLEGMDADEALDVIGRAILNSGEFNLD